MFQVIGDWFRRQFSDPEAAILVLLLLFGFVFITFFGGMLTPVLASIVVAYLLEGVVAKLCRIGLPRGAAVAMVFLIFMTFLVLVMLGLMPLLSVQLTQLVQELPSMIARGQALLLQLPEHYPSFITEQQVDELIRFVRMEIADLGQKVVTTSVASVTSLITVLVYLVLMPLLVFFFLKDKQRILDWFARYLPRQRGLASRVWREVDVQLGNYVRGKVWEILIVWAVSYLTFKLMGLHYAMLLGVVVGLSVLVPYIGATVVTIPIAVIAYFQWGWSDQFAYIMLAYAIIQALDGNVLVPLLFSEVVNLHPTAVIIAILIFGGIWGFWGVFFAIPLASLVQAVLQAWPRPSLPRPDVSAEPPADQRDGTGG